MSIEEKSCLDFSDVENSFSDFDQPTQVFHNLMPFKVREILLVSSLYDAFIVEEEGLISEMVIEEYRHLLLSSPPRVTHVTSGEEALLKIKTNRYDMVITMSKNIGMDPFVFGRKIKDECVDIPVIILATDTADLYMCQKRISEKGVDKAFFWYGDTSLFMAIVKYVEDKINVKYDTKNGDVQIILVIEDAIRDYSMLLPIIYSEIVQQTQRSISEDLNEMQRLLRRRARPKIITTDNYEDSIQLYNTYKGNMLGVISDVRFYRNGRLDPEAGHDFISYVKKDNPHVPVMLQSIDLKNRKRAEQLGAFFIYKNSSALMQDFNNFLLNHLGFGDFIFLLPKKNYKKSEEDKTHVGTVEITRASTLEEFEKALQNVPLESIRFHANRNDFSNWLMARCEFKLAKKLRPQKVSDFKTLEENRKYLINVFNENRREKHHGVMTDFSHQKFEFDSSYTKIGSKSLGGKGRGIAFIRTLFNRYNFDKKYPGINITTPSTIAISTDEFDSFLSDNNLYEFVKNNEGTSDKEIAEKFLKAKLSDDLKNKLSVIIDHFTKPLAVRSSSLLEDSQNFPFAGMYSTYMLPNNHKDKKIRLRHLCKAIKLVYASVFLKEARAYIQSTAAKIEEEKMAVIIQEIVGSDHDGRYYPTFSGVAQSYNYYPISHQKREEGIVSIAVGLGLSVVGGEKALKFSPYYPEVLPDFSTPAEIIENTQRKLYVLNTKKQQINLSEKDEETIEKIDITEIVDDGTLDYISSTYDINDGMIRDNFTKKGPHLITFASVLKYDFFPLAELLKDILKAGEKSMGCPVELEFAVNFYPDRNIKPVFSILQIRPLIVLKEQFSIELDKEERNTKNIFIHSAEALGNGVINNVKDIVYVDPFSFDSSQTIEIAENIGRINQELNSSFPYVLIGPGRWGTQDRWLGIPVKWNQISNAKVIVETAIEGFNVKPSQGTHFFQNIISRGIGYINTKLRSEDCFIDWDWLISQETNKELKFVKHVRLPTPFVIKFDGKKGRALIIKPNKTD